MSVEAILAALSAITNQLRVAATLWHVMFAVMVVLIWYRAIPRAAAASWLAVSALSVALLAWWSGNPFNTGVFVAAGIVMLRLASKMRWTPILLGSRWQVVAGLTLVAFAAVYPHFLDAASWTAYLYQAPLGLIPCPTIAAIAGVTLMTDGFQSKVWSVGIALMAAFYGLIGVLMLGVLIDVALIAAAITLLVPAARARRPA